MVYSDRAGLIHKNCSSMFVIKSCTKSTMVNKRLSDIIQAVSTRPVHSSLIGLGLISKYGDSLLIRCHA